MLEKRINSREAPLPRSDVLCFVIGKEDDGGSTRSFQRMAEQLGFETALAPTLDAVRADPAFLDAHQPLVLLPDEGHGPSKLEAALAFAQAEQGHAFLAYVAETISPEAFKRLVRTGSGDWMSPATASSELAELLRSRAGRTATARVAKVVSCWPSKGGVGNTTIAVEVGLHLAGRRKRGGTRVALFDLNFQGGTLADLLDVEPRFDIAEMIGRPERLDEQLMDVFTSRRSERLHVFASPIRPVDTAAIDSQIVFAFLDAIAGRYDVIVLDMCLHWTPWTDNLLLGSDAIVVAGGCTVPALKQLGARLARLDELAMPAGKVAVAVSGCDADLFGRIARRAEIDKALPDRRLFYVRRDDAAVTAAHDLGHPLFESAPGKRVTRDIARLSAWVEAATDGSAGPPDGPRPGASR